MEIRWSEEKNELLKRERGVSFEDVAALIRTHQELDILPHPLRVNQKIIVVRLHGYIHAVPFVEEAGGISLKTIYPNRNLQIQYGGRI
ncbi:MAG: toxin [Rectinemataceae bacterium]|jgi:uncharacterized DUF497 family protein